MAEWNCDYESTDFTKLTYNTIHSVYEVRILCINEYYVDLLLETSSVKVKSM